MVKLFREAGYLLVASSGNFYVQNDHLRTKELLILFEFTLCELF
jgi:hypothetical protein